MKQINNYIVERLRINKDTGKDNIQKFEDEYWFTDDFGIKFPFTLKFSGSPKSMDIEIYNIKQLQHKTKENRTTEVWGLFDELGRHIMNIYHTEGGVSTLDNLFKRIKHTAIVNIINKDIAKQLKKETTVVIYKDDESKILKKGRS